MKSAAGREKAGAEAPAPTFEIPRIPLARDVQNQRSRYTAGLLELLRGSFRDPAYTQRYKLAALLIATLHPLTHPPSCRNIRTYVLYTAPANGYKTHAA